MGGVDQWVRLEGWLRRPPAPLMVLCVGTMHTALFLLPTPQKWQLSILVFCILFTICPNCTHVQLFSVPYSFFDSVAGGDVCSGASAAAKGPRSQPHPPLRYSTPLD